MARGVLAQGVIGGLIAWLLIWPWFSQNWLTILSTINKARQWGVAYQDGLEANSLEGWVYYLKLLPSMLGSSLTTLVMVGGIIALVVSKPQLELNKDWLIWWLSFPLGGLLVCISCQQRLSFCPAPAATVCRGAGSNGGQHGA